VELVATSIPSVYLLKLISAISVKVDSSPHVEYYLQWSRHVLNAHGRFLKDQSR
jgi:hypothetical protein